MHQKFALFVLMLIIFGLLFDKCFCHEELTAPSVLQGYPGKRGPPGPPGDVIQCDCNASSTWKNLKNLTEELEALRLRG